MAYLYDIPYVSKPNSSPLCPISVHSSFLHSFIPNPDVQTCVSLFLPASVVLSLPTWKAPIHTHTSRNAPTKYTKEMSKGGAPAQPQRKRAAVLHSSLFWAGLFLMSSSPRRFCGLSESSVLVRLWYGVMLLFFWLRWEKHTDVLTWRDNRFCVLGKIFLTSCLSNLWSGCFQICFFRFSLKTKCRFWKVQPEIREY